MSIGRQMEQQRGEIVNTISILETVDIFEPNYVETVHIIDASETSDTEDDTLDGDDDDDDAEVIDEEEQQLLLKEDTASPSLMPLSPLQLAANRHVIRVEKRALSSGEHRTYCTKERDILHDCDEQADRRRTETKLAERKSLVPNLKEILQSSERDSFYNSDAGGDEPLVFSEDEDIPRFSLEMSGGNGGIGGGGIDSSDSETVRGELFFCFVWGWVHVSIFIQYRFHSRLYFTRKNFWSNKLN